MTPQQTDTHDARPPRFNPFLIAAGKDRLHSMASLSAVFRICRDHVWTSKRNVALSEATVRMGHSCVMYYYRKKLALPDASCCLSQGRYLIHCLTHLVACLRGGISFTAWRILLLVSGEVSRSHWHRQKRVNAIRARWPSSEGVRLESSRPGFHSRLNCASFSRSSHIGDLKFGSPEAALPGACHKQPVQQCGCAPNTLMVQWVRSQTPGNTGSALGLVGPVYVCCDCVSLICNFYLTVVARTIVLADPSLRYTSRLLGR